MKKIIIKDFLIFAFFAFAGSCFFQLFTYYNSFIGDLEQAFVILGLCSVISIILIKFLDAKDFKKDELKEKFSKKKVLILRIVLFLLNWLCYFASVIYFIIIDKEKEYGRLVDSFDGIERSLHGIIFLTSLLIISSLLIFTLFKYSFKNRFFNVLRNITGILSVVSTFAALILLVCYLLPLNEIKFVYDEYDNGVYVYSDCLNDTRVEYIDDNKLIFPSSYFGKRVIGFARTKVLASHNKNIVVELPSTLNDIDNFELRIYDENDCAIESKELLNPQITISNNEFIEIKDNIAYVNKNGKTFMYFLCDYKYDLPVINIDKNVAEINFNTYHISDRISENTILKVDPENPYITIFDNTLVYNCNLKYVDDFEVCYDNRVYLNALKPVKRGSREIYSVVINDEIAKDKIVSINYRPDEVVISADYSNPDLTIYGNAGSFYVEEGNQYYASYYGNLYNKDMTELLCLGTDTEIKLPSSIQCVSNNYLYNFSNALSKGYNHRQITADGEFNQNINEDGILYSADGKTILVLSLDIKELVIPEIVNDISETALSQIINWTVFKDLVINVDSNSSFTYDNGFLFSNNKEKLILGPKYRSYLFIPKETKEIDENLLLYFKNYFVEVDEENEFFEMYEGNLYTKGREKLLTLCNNYEEIPGTYTLQGRLMTDGEEYYTEMEAVPGTDGHIPTVSGDTVIIPSNTTEISENAFYQIFDRFVTISEDNQTYELYEGNIYTKGREKLLGITGLGYYNDEFVHRYDNYNVKYSRKIIIPSETNELSDWSMLLFHATSNSLDDFYYDTLLYKDFYREFEVDENNNHFASFDGCLYTKDYSELLFLPGYFCENMNDEFHIKKHTNDSLIKISFIPNYHYIFE